MGIDLKSGGRRTGHNVRKAPVTKNVYVKLLEKLYRWDNRDGLLVVVPDRLVWCDAVESIRYQMRAINYAGSKYVKRYENL